MRVLRPRIIQCLKEWRLRVDSSDRDPSARPLAAEREHDVSRDVQLGSQEMDARLRTMMVAFQDDTIDMVEELLLRVIADLRPQIQKNLSPQACVCRQMDAETQTHPSSIHGASQIETSSETNGQSPNASQSTDARTPKSRERMTRADSDLESGQIRPGIQAGVTELDRKSDGKVPKPPARIPQQPIDLADKDSIAFNTKIFEFGGTQTAPLFSTGLTDQSKDLPRPKLQHSASAVIDSQTPPSSLDFGRLAGLGDHSTRALSTGNLHQKHALQDPIRSEAQISSTITPFKGAFHQDDNKNEQVKFTFRI